jgi:hypothetical protein
MALKRKAGLFQIAIAVAHAIAVVILGYRMLGPVPALLFAGGFVGGFAAWTLIPARPRFQTFRAAFYLALALFVLHKVEEREMDFSTALAQLTGMPVPEPQSFQVYALYALASAWLLVPLLAGRGIELGFHLAWSFFASMGLVELARCVFPFFTEDGFGYFPGMVSASVLAPAAWLGIWSLSRPESLYSR